MQENQTQHKTTKIKGKKLNKKLLLYNERLTRRIGPGTLDVTAVPLVHGICMQLPKVSALMNIDMIWIFSFILFGFCLCVFLVRGLNKCRFEMHFHPQTIVTIEQYSWILFVYHLLLQFSYQ